MPAALLYTTTALIVIVDTNYNRDAFTIVRFVLSLSSTVVSIMDRQQPHERGGGVLVKNYETAAGGWLWNTAASSPPSSISLSLLYDAPPSD